MMVSILHSLGDLNPSLSWKLSCWWIRFPQFWFLVRSPLLVYRGSQSCLLLTGWRWQQGCGEITSLLFVIWRYWCHWWRLHPRGLIVKGPTSKYFRGLSCQHVHVRRYLAHVSWERSLGTQKTSGLLVCVCWRCSSAAVTPAICHFPSAGSATSS